MKPVLTDNTREMRCPVRVRRKNPKNKWWNDAVKSAVERKEVESRGRKSERNIFGNV